MGAAITAETFTPHIGKSVSLSNGWRLTLAAVDVPKSSRPDGPAGFTLLLRGACSPVAPEGLYTVAIEGGPSVALYVIPVHTPSPAHQDYQVVFN